MLFRKHYISQIGESNLKEYKYHGKTDSIVYNKIMGPFAEFLVNRFVPSWVAPNLITTVAFVINLIPHIILMYYAKDGLKGEIPTWLSLFLAFGLFVYMNLDNMDGKQARKTQTSSPLGMLLDHGLDTVSSWMVGLNLATIAQIGNSWLGFWCIVWTTIIPVYVLFWEENITGEIYFPAINGVDEGLIIIVGFFLWTALKGSAWWLTKTPFFDLEWNYLIISVALVSGMFTLAASIYKVLRTHKGPLFPIFEKLGIVATTLISMGIVSYFSPAMIVQTQTRLVVYFYGFAWVREIARLLVANCANIKFEQWTKAMLFADLSIAINALVAYFTNGKGLIDEVTFLYIGIAINFALYLQYSISIIKQIKKILNLRLFRIKGKAQ